MMRRRLAKRALGVRRWSVEVLEARRLLSAGVLDEHGDHCADDHGDHGERYVAPKTKPKKGKAPKLSFAAQQDLALAISADADVSETEGNNTPGTATPIVVGATNNLITGSIGASGDLDYFSFSLSQRAGVFLDIDAKDIGLSGLDSRVTVYNSTGTTVQAENDDGDDFEQFALNDTTATPHSDDASLYLDLNPGTYLIRVSASSTASSSVGAYQLKVRSDTNYTTTVPALDSYYPYSFPGQTHTDTLYLDFNGHSSSTDSWATRDIDPNTSGTQPNGPYTIAPFDLNGNPNEWTPGERAVLENVWRVVAEDFRPFNINVSTREPSSIGDGVAHRQVIGNSTGVEVGHGGSLGVAFRPSYNSNGANNNVAFTFASNFTYVLGTGVTAAGMSGWIGAAAVEMGNTTSHEFGHALGLRHYGGNNPQPNGIMHTPDFGLSRERWKIGNTHDGESGGGLSQDDVAVISGTSNTLGYLPDDLGNTTGTAATMVLFDGALRRDGVIGNKTDLDVFRFESRGATTVSVSVLEHVANLDAELRLYNSAGTLLATSDPSTSITASITQDLPQGTYYAEVRSDGGDGEVGSYGLTVVSPTTNPSRAPANPLLRPESDTGSSAFDGVTSRNNSSAAHNLVFSVGGATAGATVTVYAAGVAIGSAVVPAGATSVNVATNGTFTLADGGHPFTARQTEPGRFESVDSGPTFVTIDTVAPTVDVTDVSPDPRATELAAARVVFSRPISGFTWDDLALTRDGVAVPLSSQNQPAGTGDGRTFDVPNLGALTRPAGTYVLSVKGSGTGIADALAGNALAAGASDTWVNNNVPPTIGSLTASPSRIAPNTTMTLTANDVADANGTPVTVTFYRESNGTAGLQVGLDTQVGSPDSTSPYGLSLTAPAAAGTYTYYARAVDPAQAAGTASRAVNVEVPFTPTPGAPDLVATYDTGKSDTDNILNPFLAGPDGTVTFDVPGTVPGAVVRVLVDGQAIGNTVAESSTTRVTTFPDFRFQQGTYLITAEQYEPGWAVSGVSDALTITVDHLAPGAFIAGVPGGPRRTPVPSLDITFSEPVHAFDVDDLVLTRETDGQVSGNLLSSANSLTTTDGLSYTLANLATITSSPGFYRLAFAAAFTPPGPSVFDTAGNRLEGYNESAWLRVSDPPKVTAVFVAGTAWTAGYRNGLEARGEGEAAYGYRINPAEQTRTLGWANLNQVSVRFSHPVAIAAGHLVVNGVNLPQYLLADADGFRYDAATHTATWTLRRAIANDKVTLDLDGDQGDDGPGVTDAETGELLDGEWTNPVAPAVAGDAFPTGDGIAGGDFVFDLRVLPGDVTRDGAVNVFDQNVLRTSLNQTGRGVTGGDLNGDDLVDVIDFNLYRGYLNRTTPV